VNTSAIIVALSWLTPHLGKLWRAQISGRSILEHIIENCTKSGVIDKFCVMTDDVGLMEHGQDLGAPIFPCPEIDKDIPLNSLSIELYSLYREYYMVQQIGMHEDLTFFIPWNMPLLNGRTLEKMYHTLLDDPLAARIIPISPIDPHLFTKLEGSGEFFPVWGHKALDRQLIQPLFHLSYASIVHWQRLFKAIPKLAGITIDKTRFFTVESEQDVELAEYLYNYALRKDECPA
jgi:CMP-N-acetylneuraminic acid synthetase